ncbi:MAG: GNAT family N-acetyltransferase [Methanomassiliicoccaceae archaeon]|jgi:ribosomal protein S18 acetylase RimI-like enzyme|nr:GNAT family N-acetyltransferase [Methanomassiliicoccaceae archaeon]
MDIIKLEAEHTKKAAELLAAAFFNYPMMVRYFPDPKKRKRRLTWYMKNVLNSAIRYGEAFVTPDITGALFMLPPGHTRLTTNEYIKSGFLMTPLVMGYRNYKLSNECEKFVADTHERQMNGREHYYLWGLVVDPGTQRKGVGSALMKIIIDKADTKNVPIYLETHDKNNVDYYERFGFKLIHTGTITGHGLEFWCMLRETGV